MQQKRSRAVWIVAIAIAFFFIVDPFRIFSGGKIPTARIDRETESELADFVAKAPGAADTVIAMLGTSDLVLIGETGYAREQVQFAADLIPRLDSADVRVFGYQYADTEDQALIDRLLTAPTFDEDLARQILFNHLTVFGFQEHVDIFRAAWQINRRKSSGDTPFRIVALSNRLDYEAITNEDDIKDPEVMQAVFASGVPDATMARILGTEVLDRGTKAVAYLQLDHAFTGLSRTGYEDDLRAVGFTDVRRAGNELRASYGDRVVTAALHGPIQNSRSRIGFGYPTGGILDRAVAQIGEGATAGFAVAGSPFEQVPIAGDIASEPGNETLTLGRYADAYLVVAPIGGLHAVTAIPDFITESNLDEAVRRFPGVRPENPTVKDMNDFIAGNAASMARVFAEFD